MEDRGPYRRHLSRSTSELSQSVPSTSQNHNVKDGLLSENLCDGIQAVFRPSTAPIVSTTGQKTPDQTAVKKESTHKSSHNFFAALKMRWSRSRSKERKKGRKGEKLSEELNPDGDTSYSTDYAADNSSEHSSSATQSPQHRLTPKPEIVPPNLASESIKRQQTPSMSLDTPLNFSGPTILIGDEEMRKRETALRQHSFFQLKIHLKRGVNLVARDKTGTSDPYVKFKVGGRLLYKSKIIYRDLNPIWDETFTIPIEDPFIPVHIKVFDYDWGLQDDFMGSVYLDLTKLDLGKSSEERLELRDPNKTEYLGEIYLSATLIPRSQQDKDALCYQTMHTMKTKLARLGREKTSEDEKLPEDNSEDDADPMYDEGRESKRRRLKQKLVQLRRRLAEDLEELPKDRLKARISRLAEKLKKDDDEIVFDDAQDQNEKQKASVIIKKKIVKLGGKIRKDLDEEELTLRSKLGKFVMREDDDDDYFEDCVDDSDNKMPLATVFKEKVAAFNERFSKKEVEEGKSRLTKLRTDKDEDKEGNTVSPVKKVSSTWDSSDADLLENMPPNDEDSISISGSDGSANFIQAENIFEKIGQRLKERTHKVHRYFQRGTKLGDVNRRLKSQIWSSVVTIVLVEAKNLQPMDIDGFSDPYIKFRLGNEKFKSKVIYKSLNPSWLEQFDLHLYDDQNQELEVTVWDKDRSKDDFMGRCTIDLSALEREKTHNLWQELEDGAGSIHLLLTISGTTASETISDLTTYEENPRERTNIINRYALRQTLHNLRDVGHLTVKVFRATGLAAADLGGKSDPFCVLELVNARLQTQTEYKTLSPSWQKIFTFNVKDINSVLEITVYDEDRDHKVEFLGRIAIPLLRIKNGEKRWYCLKDKKLTARAKGNCPMILLELWVVWNPIRACIRTLNPKEEKLMQAEVKFKRQVFVRNVLRLRAIILTIFDWGKFIQDCFEWEKPAQSAIALVLFIALCYYFEPYMILAACLIIFLRNYIVHSLTGGRSAANDEEDLTTCDEDEDDDDKDKEEKKTLKERLQAIQEVTQTVQNAIGYIASLGEQIKNAFNFSVPFVSWLAVVLTITGMMVVYFVPVRYLIMFGGVNKFARKLIRPHTVPNNEILDLLSRVPDDEQLIAYKELKPYPSESADRRRDNRRKNLLSTS